MKKKKRKVPLWEAFPHAELVDALEAFGRIVSPNFVNPLRDSSPTVKDTGPVIVTAGNTVSFSSGWPTTTGGSTIVLVGGPIKEREEPMMSGMWQRMERRDWVQEEIRPLIVDLDAKPKGKKGLAVTNRALQNSPHVPPSVHARSNHQHWKNRR